MNHEKQPNIENKLDQQELNELANERLQEKAEQLEKRTPERSSAERAAESKHEALEQARSTEKKNRPANQEARRDTPPSSKAARKEAFDSIMSDVQSQMSPTQRAFSKFIHAPVVEKVSDVTGKTVARPNAILAGSLTAFVLVLAVYLVARHYGYTLSGAETIAAFAAGWALGLVFDFLRLMVTGRHN